MSAHTDLAGLAPFALLQIDPRRRVIAANPEAQSVLGHSQRAMMDRPLSEVVFHDSPLFDLIDRALALAGDVTAHGVSIKGPALSQQRSFDVRLRPTGDGAIILAFIPATDHETIDSSASVAAFGRILGHEVKNPLAGISGAAQLLQREARDDQTAMLAIIQSETRRIERLVSRLSAFELFSLPSIQPFNIHALLDKVIAAEEMAQNSQVEIKRLYDPSLPELDGDQDHLHEAFQNILRNASEAALSGHDAPAISIQTAFETGFAIAGAGHNGPLGRAIRISVEDNGAGISPDRRDKIFDLFTSSKSGGRGLGLNVVSEIINAHSGRIKIDSKPGQTRFSVYLPIKRKPET